MDIPREPTGTEIVSFLNTLTGSQMARLVTSLHEPAAQLEFTMAMASMPPPVVDPSATPQKAKKGLNGFVGFRCYYIRCPSFKQYTMKKFSGVAGKMWEVDPNHSVWSLVTKAWSTIRDQIGKPKAPLDHYLTLVCPLVNLPPPNVYLGLQGWSVTPNDEGELMLERNCLAQSPSISARCAEVSLSVEDIIKYCQQYGYAVEFVHDENATSATFLAYPQQQTPGEDLNMNEVVEEEDLNMNQVVEEEDDDHETRLRAKDERRAERQVKKDTGLASALKEQIGEMYVFDDDEMQIEEDHEPMSPSFHGQAAGMLTNNLNNVPTNNMTGNNAAVNNTAGNTAGNTAAHPATVNNMGGSMGGSMINNNAVLPDVPTQNPDELDFGYEQTDSEDDQMDLEGGENDIQAASKDMTNNKAFRNGANEDATLPLFHQNNL